MRQDDRAPFDRALHRARVSAYPPGEFVGQESFMTAAEIRALAVQAGIGAGVAVLDLCCGIAGPGRLLTRELGCAYLGVDASAERRRHRPRARGRPALPLRGRADPAPAGRLLRRRAPARDDARLRGQGRAGPRDRRGAPAERAIRVHARGGTAAHGGRAGGDARLRHGVAHPARRDAPRRWGGRGWSSRWQEDHSRAHRASREALAEAFTADAEAIAAQIGRRALDDLLAAHRLWIEWLDAGRVRKLALVAERGVRAEQADEARLRRSAEARAGGDMPRGIESPQRGDRLTLP